MNQSLRPAGKDFITQNLMQVLPLGRGLTVEVHDFLLREDFQVRYEVDFPVAMMFYTCLSGEMVFRYPKQSRHIFNGLSGMEYLAGGLEASTEIRACRPVRVFCVYLDPVCLPEITGRTRDEFMEMLERIPKGRGKTRPGTKVLDAAMGVCALQALGAAAMSPNDALFLEAKALELISRQIKKLEIISGMAPAMPDSGDMEREKVLAASEILRREMEDPPDGRALGRRVGLSYPDLLSGFKQILGMTPVAYLRAARLQQARDLLTAGRANVTETALHVGYSSLSHFTKAFYREFGVTPRQCRPKMS